MKVWSCIYTDPKCTLSAMRVAASDESTALDFALDPTWVEMGGASAGSVLVSYMGQTDNDETGVIHLVTRPRGRVFP